MRIIGFDPSLSSTGWCLLKDNKIECFGTIKTEKGDKRYYKIYNAVLDLLDKYSPEEVHIETPFIGTNSRTGIELAQCRGVILLLCEAFDIPLVNFAPQEVKKKITGNGRAEKSLVASEIIKIFKEDDKIKEIGPFSDKNNKNKTSDIYDALAVAYVNKEDLENE